MKSVNVINSAYCKKLQSQTKSIVQNFGKLILLWRNDSSQVDVLVNELDNLHNEWMAIINQKIKSDENRIFSGTLMLEIEQVFVQLRMFEKRLADVLNAMNLAVNDAMKVITNEPVEIFPEESIFTSDHYLDMQQMYRNYVLEMSRKSELLRSITADPTVMTVNNATMDTEKLLRDLVTLPITSVDKTESHFRISKKCLSICVEQWSDVCELSMIHSSAVDEFLTKNNLCGET